jgi:MFS family permease
MQCGDKSVLSLALVAIWTCLFCDYLLLTIAIPIFPTLAVCASSDVLTGVLFSSKAVMQIVFSPLVSCFVDRFALELLIGGMAVEGCATVVFTLTRSYPLWLIGRGTQGIASAAIITAAFAYLQRHYVDDKQRGVAMSVATTGIIGGVMLGPPIGGLLYGVWQPAPFVASMVLCAVAAVGVVVLRLQVKRQCCWRGLPVAGGNAASGSAIVRSDAADSDVPMTELAALESVGEGSDVANDGGGGGGGRRRKFSYMYRYILR